MCLGLRYCLLQNFSPASAPKSHPLGTREGEPGPAGHRPRIPRGPPRGPSGDHPGPPPVTAPGTQVLGFEWPNNVLNPFNSDKKGGGMLYVFAVFAEMC